MSHSMSNMLLHFKAAVRMPMVLACVVMFAGCSFAPKYAKPSVQTPAAFKELTQAQFNETDGWKTAEPKDDLIRGQWWEVFHDPELNAFESQVAGSNQSVAAALANFLAARAVVKQARSQYFPTVTAGSFGLKSRQQINPTSSSSDCFHHSPSIHCHSTPPGSRISGAASATR